MNLGRCLSFCRAATPLAAGQSTGPDSTHGRRGADGVHALPVIRHPIEIMM